MDNFYYNYTKKQLRTLYMEAVYNEITDKRLDRIKEALHETVLLAQYDKWSFQCLIDTLLGLSDSALNDIVNGNFSRFYKAYYKHNHGMSEDYFCLSILLEGLYTDYKKIQNIEDYKSLCNSMRFIYDMAMFHDKDIDEPVKRINHNLANLLTTNYNNTDYELIKQKKYNMFDSQAIGKIIVNLLVTFMMFIDNYNYDFTLPSELLNSMIDRIKKDDLIKIASYINYDYNIAKMLLDAQYNKKEYMNNLEELLETKSNSKALKLK